VKSIKKEHTFYMHIDEKSERFLGDGRANVDANRWCSMICELSFLRKKVARLEGKEVTVSCSEEEHAN